MVSILRIFFSWWNNLHFSSCSEKSSSVKYVVVNRKLEGNSMNKFNFNVLLKFEKIILLIVKYNRYWMLRI